MSILKYKLRHLLKSGLDVVESIIGAFSFFIVALPVFFKVPENIIHEAVDKAEYLFLVFLTQHLLRSAQNKTFSFNKNKSFFFLTAVYISFFLVILFDWPFASVQYHLNYFSLAFLSISGAKSIFSLVVHADRSSTKFLYRELTGPQLFTLSFFLTIVLGTLLLMTPKASVNGLSFIDALFTSVSATCVTGLAVVSTQNDLTLVGKTIVLFLFQIGGLGTMTFAMGISGLIGSGLSFKNKILLSDIISSNNLSDIRSVLIKMLYLTFTIELVGAALLYFFMPTVANLTYFEYIYTSVFHAVSAFCNAGFSVYDSSLSSMDFVSSPFYLFTICVLIVSGGLGFPVLSNLTSSLLYKARMSLHTKVVLLYSAIFLLLGGVLVYFLEKSFYFKGQSQYYSVVNSIFTTVTARTAGFNTLSIELLSTPSLMLLCGLMFIGGAPMSTAGGLKVTTFAVAFSHLYSKVRKIKKAVIFKKRITEQNISDALNMISLSLLTIFIAIFLLSILERDLAFEKIIFEAFSALGTVGLSMGVTANLSPPSKIILCVLMFVGRVNILVFLDAVVRNARNRRVEYIKEDLIL